MLNPNHEKAKQVAANYYATLKKLKIKEKIIKLPQGYGSDKIQIQNYKRDSKDKPEKKKGSNVVNSLDISKVGRLHEQGFNIPQIAEKIGSAETKVRYRLKLYKDGKANQKTTEITDGNLPEKQDG